MTESTTWDASPTRDGEAAAWVAVAVGARRLLVDLPRGADVAIGRSGSSGIPVDDPSVSRLHATLRWDGGDDLLVTDHASRNGTFVRGTRVEGARRARSGDEIRVGPARLLPVLPGPEPSAPPDDEDALIRDGTMRRVIALADRAATSDLPVLLIGETGAGKEVLARRIHRRSKRAARPFVATNCGSIPESLAEATLFGHERGAFTGASELRAGLFEAASCGTLLLDEIGELSPKTQSRLLRVLAELAVTRVGATASTPVDVRLISATHRDLDVRVREGTFRQDLLYRIDVIRIAIPPLRERPDDILPLALSFLRTIDPDLRLTPSAELALCAYAWPGNVRELKNAITRATALHERGPIEVEALGLGQERAEPALQGAVADAERKAIVLALDACAGNRTHAARRLGISRRTLLYKMERLGLKPPPARDQD